MPSTKTLLSDLITNLIRATKDKKIFWDFDGFIGDYTWASPVGIVVLRTEMRLDFISPSGVLFRQVDANSPELRSRILELAALLSSYHGDDSHRLNRILLTLQDFYPEDFPRPEALPRV
jgi:hypothetical protein